MKIICSPSVSNNVPTDKKSSVSLCLCPLEEEEEECHSECHKSFTDNLCFSLCALLLLLEFLASINQSSDVVVVCGRRSALIRGSLKKRRRIIIRRGKKERNSVDNLFLNSPFVVNFVADALYIDSPTLWCSVACATVSSTTTTHSYWQDLRPPTPPRPLP